MADRKLPKNLSDASLRTYYRKGLLAMVDSREVPHPGGPNDTGQVLATERGVSFGMERKKVLLSVTEEDLKVIDEKAATANMSRSAYLVAMGRQGAASLFDAIARLEVELNKFKTDAGGVKGEIDRVRGENQRLQIKLSKALGMLEHTVDVVESNPETPRATIVEMRNILRALRS